jgi:cephalosporin hydroxylase
LPKIPSGKKLPGRPESMVVYDDAEEEINMMNPLEVFENEVRNQIDNMGEDKNIRALSQAWTSEITAHRYTYNFRWLGRPVIQLPQDLVALQELIWEVKPDLILETGIAHGGSLIMSASLLTLIDHSEAIEQNKLIDPKTSTRRVLGVDIDIRAHNRAAIDAHPMSHRIDMIQGSSIAAEVIAQVHAYARNFNKIFVCLDSNHTHDHVLAELQAYAPLVKKGSYCVVFDTVIDDLPDTLCSDRPWGRGNNPKTAVKEFLETTDRFVIDQNIDNKLLISAAPGGYLKCVKD